MKAAKVLLIAFIFLAAQGSFLLHLGDFAFVPGGEYSDLAISHYPNAVFLKDSIQRYGEIPLWSNSILSGYPFMADPLSGIHYPFGWIALIFPLPLGFNILLSLHLILGAFGFYYLLKERGCGEGPAVLGGVCFVLIPRLWAHLAAGHLTLIYATCWTSWLLLTTTNKHLRDRGLSGLVLGMIILADIRWAGYVALPWLAYYITISVDVSNQLSQNLRACLKLALQGLIGILISAVLILPLFEFTQLSTRASLSTTERTVFSLPPQQFFGLLFPDFFGYVEWTLYPGVMFILAYLWSWLQPDLRKQTRFLRWLILLIYLFSIGSNSVITSWLFQLPIFAFLRVPARLALVGNIFWIILFIHWVDFLIKTTRYWAVKAIRLGMVGICGIMIIFTGGVWGYSPEHPPVNLIWGCAICVAGCVILFRQIHRPTKNLAYIILLLVVIDLAGVNYLSVTYRPVEQVVEVQEDVAEYLSQKSGYFRTFSPSYSIPQQVAAEYGLQLADGINPLQLRAYVDFMKTAAGFGEGYSVTLPPFITGNPQIDNRGVVLDTVYLGMLNIRYIAAEYDLTGDRLQKVQQFGSTRIYENLDAQPRAWLLTGRGQTQIMPIADDDIKWSPNRIEVKVSGWGGLVLSEVAYPGWSAKVDGQKAEISASNQLLRVVQIDENKHLVKFEFVPGSLFAGLIISCSTFLALIVWFRRKSDR